MSTTMTNPSTVPLPEIMTIEELAEYLCVPPTTIYQWRYRSEGPVAIKIGRLLRFRRDDVVTWLDSRRDAGH